MTITTNLDALAEEHASVIQSWNVNVRYSWKSARLFGASHEAIGVDLKVTAEQVAEFIAAGDRALEAAGLDPADVARIQTRNLDADSIAALRGNVGRRDERETRTAARATRPRVPAFTEAEIVALATQGETGRHPRERRGV